MKKILTIVALSLCGVIATVVLIMGIVKTDFNQLITNDATYINVYMNGNSNSYNNDSDEFDELYKLYYKGTKEVVLSSLFQGAYSSDANAEINKSTTTLSSLTSSTSKTYLKFHYADAKQVILNGEVYEDDTLTTTDKTVYYTDVLVEIAYSSVLTKVTAYIQNIDSYTSSTYQVSFVTNHVELYDYITELNNEGELR